MVPSLFACLPIKLYRISTTIVFSYPVSKIVWRWFHSGQVCLLIWQKCDCLQGALAALVECLSIKNLHVAKVIGISTLYRRIFRIIPSLTDNKMSLLSKCLEMKGAESGQRHRRSQLIALQMSRNLLHYKFLEFFHTGEKLKNMLFTA